MWEGSGTPEPHPHPPGPALHHTHPATNAFPLNGQLLTTGMEQMDAFNRDDIVTYVKVKHSDVMSRTFQL